MRFAEYACTPTWRGRILPIVRREVQDATGLPTPFVAAPGRQVEELRAGSGLPRLRPVRRPGPAAGRLRTVGLGMSDLATFPTMEGRGAGAGLRARALRAVVAAIRPRGHGFDQPIDDDVVRDVEAGLRHVPRSLRLWITLGLYFVEFGAPLLARRFCRFSSLSPEVGFELLAPWEHARGVRHSLLRGLRFLIFFSFYQHPLVLQSLEVDWAGRAATLAHLRAELLGQTPVPRAGDGANG